MNEEKKPETEAEELEQKREPLTTQFYHLGVKAFARQQAQDRQELGKKVPPNP